VLGVGGGGGNEGGTLHFPGKRKSPIRKGCSAIGRLKEVWKGGKISGLRGETSLPDSRAATK